jgi:hypothetical protein
LCLLLSTLASYSIDAELESISLGTPVSVSQKTRNYLRGELFRVVKSVGNTRGQDVTTFVLCAPRKTNTSDGALWQQAFPRTAGHNIAANAAGNGLNYVVVDGGLIILEHYTESTDALSGSLVTDIKGKSLADVKEFMQGHFESAGERVPSVGSAEQCSRTTQMPDLL